MATVGEHVVTGSDTTRSLVSERFGQASDYATSAWATTLDFLNDLTDVVSNVTFTDPDIDYDTQTVNFTSDIESKRPEPPVITMEDIEVPTVPTLQTMPSVYTPDVPVLDAMSPEVSIPDYPDVTMPVEPGTGPSIRDIELPAVPQLEVITTPTITYLSAVGIPEYQRPQFEGEMPISDITPPEPMFTWTDTEYTSTVLDALKVKVLADIQAGNVGIDTAAEAAMWARARARKDLQNEAMYDEALNFFSSRGYNLPPGALNGKLLQIMAEISRAETDINNDLTVNRSNLALDYAKHLLSTGIQLESALMNHSNEMANRSFMAAKAVVDTTITAYDAKVKHFNLKLEVYRTAAQVYVQKTQAASLELERYKSELEALRLNGQLQQINVDLFKSRIAANEQLVSQYRAELEAKATEINAERLKLDVYKTTVDAYVATVGAKTAQFNLYQARIAGEESKVRLYEGQVRAYATQVEAIKTTTSARNMSIEATSLYNRGLIEAFSASVEKYKTSLLKETSRIDAEIKVFNAKVAEYDADAKVAGIDLETQSKVLAMRIEQAKNQADLALKSAEVALQNARQYYGIQVEAAKAGASVAAQITASALSSVNATAHLSYSAQSQESIGTDYNYDQTKERPTTSFQYQYTQASQK